MAAAGPTVRLGAVQPKPVIGSPGDRYEQEANTVARQVASGGSVRSISRLPEGALGAQRQEKEEEDEVVQKQSDEEEEEEPVQTQKREEEEEDPDVQKKGVTTSSGARAGSDGSGRPFGTGDSRRGAAARAIRQKGPGRPMHEPTRRTLERRMGTDLSHVRIHDGPHARASAERLNARAFTHGAHVWMGRGASDRDLTLMAHEATHVVQQGAAERSGAVSRPSTVSRSRRDRKATGSGVRGIVQGSWLSSAWGAVKSGVETIKATAAEIADWAMDKVLSVLGDYLPEAAIAFIQDVREKGIVGALYGQIKDVVAEIFTGLGGDETTITSLKETFTDFVARAQTVVNALMQGDCEPLFTAIGDLKRLLSDVAGRAWEKITDFLEPVKDFLDDVWDKLGSPIVEWIEDASGGVWAKLKSVWDDIKAVGEEIGSIASDIGSALWGKVKELLGFGGGQSDSEEGEGGGIGAWIKEQASAAWEQVTDALQPVIDPIEDVVSKAQSLLPLDAIKNMQEAVEGFSGNMGQMDAAASNPDDIAKNQKRLREAILPTILGAIDSVRNVVGSAKSWLTSTIDGLTEPITTFFSEVQNIDLLSGVAGALEWVESGVLSLKDWASNKAATLFDFVDDALQSLKEFARPTYRTLMKIVDVLGDFVGSIKDLIVGTFWGQIPACIREKIEDFLVNQILSNVPFFNKLMGIKDAWDSIVNTAYTALYQVFVDGDLLGAAWTVFTALLNALDIPQELVVSLVNNALKAFHNIFSDPIGFLGNVIESLQLGLQNFIDNFGTHVLGGLKDWLFGALEENNITPPEEFTFQEVFRFLLDLFDITLESILDKIAEHLGVDRALIDRVIERIQHVIELVGDGLEWVRKLNSEGPSALWTWLQDKITGLWETVQSQLIQYISVEVIQKAVEKLALALTPTGVSQVLAVVDSIWSAIQAAAEYITRMIEVVNSVFESVNAIAEGSLEPAAARIENTLSRSIPVAIGFLAHQVGLGDLPRRLGSIIESVQDVVDTGIDRLIAGAANLLTSAVETVRGGISAAKEKLVQWWKQDATFTRDGESHSVGFAGEKENAELRIASTPRPVEAFLSEERTRISKLNDAKEKSRQEDILEEIETEVQEIQNIKTKGGTRDQSSFGVQDGKDIQTHLNKIADLIGGLGKDREVPPSIIELSTREAEIPIANTGRTETSEDAELMNAPVLSLRSNDKSGSQPTQSSALWQEVRVRSGAYVRGHLLNHHVHGPGSKENLTPITSSLNQIMERQVEDKVKNMVLGENRVVEYRVEAVYGEHRPRRKWLPAENYMPTHLLFDLKELSKEEGTDGSDSSHWEGNYKESFFEKKPMENTLPPDTNPFTQSVLKHVNLKDWMITGEDGEPLENSRSIVKQRLREIPGIGDVKADVLLDQDAWSTWNDLRNIENEAGNRLFSDEDINNVRTESARGGDGPLFSIDSDEPTIYEPLREPA